MLRIRAVLALVAALGVAVAVSVPARDSAEVMTATAAHPPSPLVEQEPDGLLRLTTTTTAPPTTTTEPPPPPTTTTTEAPPPPPPPAPPSTEAAAPRAGNCGGWEGTIAAYFPASQISTACRVMMCESGGNPSAHNPSGASGLFQVMPGWADEYQRVTGLPYYDGRFNGDANTRFAAWLQGTDGWGHWVCA